MAREEYAAVSATRRALGRRARAAGGAQAFEDIRLSSAAETSGLSLPAIGYVGMDTLARMTRGWCVGGAWGYHTCMMSGGMLSETLG